MIVFDPPLPCPDCAGPIVMQGAAATPEDNDPPLLVEGGCAACAKEFRFTYLDGQFSAREL
jgi:hypothetical protein